MNGPLFFIGFVSLVVGLWLVSPALALVVGGTLLMGWSALDAYLELKRKKPK